jgi:integrase
VLYSLRHTFLTRLSEDAVLDAISRLGGHRIGHNENAPAQLPVAKNAISAVQ